MECGDVSTAFAQGSNVGGRPFGNTHHHHHFCCNHRCCYHYITIVDIAIVVSSQNQFANLKELKLFPTNFPLIWSSKYYEKEGYGHVLFHSFASFVQILILSAFFFVMIMLTRKMLNLHRARSQMSRNRDRTLALLANVSPLGCSCCRESRDGQDSAFLCFRCYWCCCCYVSFYCRSQLHHSAVAARKVETHKNYDFLSILLLLFYLLLSL